MVFKRKFVLQNRQLSLAANRYAIFSMTKILWTYLLTLHFLTAFSKSPTNPYTFNAPNFDQILPFSKEELQIFREKWVNKVEVYNEDYCTEFNFNEKGLLISNKEILRKKKKELIISSTIYKYNDIGLLTVKHFKSEYNIYYDSLSYDNKGRIIHYYNSEKSLKGKKKYQIEVVYYNLNLISSNNTEVVLVDSSYDFVSYYTLDNLNQVRLIKTSNQSDSVSTEPLNDKSYTKRYWYKTEKDTIYKVGQEFTYKDNLLQTEILWDKLWGGTGIVHKTFYTYDQSNLLVRVENDNKFYPKFFYSYYNFGLIREFIQVEWGTANVTRYNYKFTP